jgi:hypothetical protein
MKCAVLVPTRNRPELLKRAILTFVAAANSTELDIVNVTVADDSTMPARTLSAIKALKAELPELSIEHVRRTVGTSHADGPGITRTRGLHHIAESGVRHDSIIMFDDDVSFADCIYQGAPTPSAGTALLTEAVRLGASTKTITGCGYVGRQDLAVLDHIVLLASLGSNSETSASNTRDGILHDAPGGISGAFLFVPARATELPPFLPWYNEDYFWLRRAVRDGWHLHRSGYTLAHAPEDGLNVSFEKLWFEQYGEALWCASVDAKAATPAVEVTCRALDGLRGRLDDFQAALIAIKHSGNPELRFRFASIIMRVHAIFKEMLDDMKECRRHGLIDDLRQVLRYCGEESARGSGAVPMACSPFCSPS